MIEVLVIVIALVLAFVFGRKSVQADIAKDNLEEIKDDIKLKKEIKERNVKLSDTALDDKLRKWTR